MDSMQHSRKTQHKKDPASALPEERQQGVLALASGERALRRASLLEV
jgi:hypothetical protein